MRFLSILLALTLPVAAQAQSQVALTSNVMVEHTITDANGVARTSLDAPGIVTPGDKLVFVLAYRNNAASPATDFVVTNPIPESVSYNGSESADSVLSVDGGRTWGQLAALSVRNADGSRRPATLADVTHVRWHMARPIPAGGAGELRFRGIVK
ncbi:hypothetical protein [Allosphingosinicella sp.]|uniref:hypothetical protein n=1 Tax=Allosphingosinicella sp. TaxID=2823234 RepID=UPI003784868C